MKTCLTKFEKHRIRFQRRKQTNWPQSWPYRERLSNLSWKYMRSVTTKRYFSIPQMMYAIHLGCLMVNIWELCTCTFAICIHHTPRSPSLMANCDSESVLYMRGMCTVIYDITSIAKSYYTIIILTQAVQLKGTELLCRKSKEQNPHDSCMINLQFFTHVHDKSAIFYWLPETLTLHLKAVDAKYRVYKCYRA